MRLKRGLTGVVLLLSAAFMVLECTCSMAYASFAVQTETVEAVPSCHKSESEAASKSTEDCCGKCQLDRTAEIQSSSSSNLSQSQQKTFKSSIALPVREILLKSSLSPEVLRQDAGDFLRQSLDYSPAAPRAPPVI